jgi:hypothetical protein
MRIGMMAEIYKPAYQRGYHSYCSKQAIYGKVGA